jgi:hypothetical protein
MKDLGQPNEFKWINWEDSTNLAFLCSPYLIVRIAASFRTTTTGSTCTSFLIAQRWILPYTVRLQRLYNSYYCSTSIGNPFSIEHVVIHAALYKRTVQSAPASRSAFHDVQWSRRKKDAPFGNRTRGKRLEGVYVTTTPMVLKACASTHLVVRPAPIYNYSSSKIMLHHSGIEPEANAWKAFMLPLHQWCFRLISVHTNILLTYLHIP